MFQPSLHIPQHLIKGAAGAGDALAAGILLGMHEAWPIEQCLRLGVSCAAASLFDATCSGGIRSAAACLGLIDTFGFSPA